MNSKYYKCYNCALLLKKLWRLLRTRQSWKQCRPSGHKNS